MTLILGVFIAMLGITAGVFLEAWDARQPHRLTGVALLGVRARRGASALHWRSHRA